MSPNKATIGESFRAQLRSAAVGSQGANLGERCVGKSHINGHVKDARQVLSQQIIGGSRTHTHAHRERDS